MNEDASPRDPAVTADLGFTYRSRRSGVVELLRHGRLVATLRGAEGHDFMVSVKSCGDAEAQQLMARLTGNYRRGNERTARDHPRNRR